MTDGNRRRWPRIALALVVAILVALALSRWNLTEEEQAGRAGRPSSGTVVTRAGATSRAAPVGVAVARTPAQEPISADAAPTRAARTAQPTPGIFDFAAITPQPPAAPSGDDERFVTNDQFTQQDLDHPERYFDAAARAPALNKRESRRDTLDFFRAYRAKLERDVALPANQDRRAEILSIIARYDGAIERLQAMIVAD